MLKQIKKDLLNNKPITKQTALALLDVDLDQLCHLANEIRQHFCQQQFDLCSIINGKSGKCSENCKFCAQSAFHHTSNDDYPLLSLEEIKNEAIHNASKGVQRFSIVTSGKKLTEQETDKLSCIYQDLTTNVKISLCASHGLLDFEQLQQLKNSGVKRYHNNLETSENFFPKICTTHTYQDKLNTLKAAQLAGLEICSGGIMGLGETWEDRIDLAFTLHHLKISSVPLNFLSPIAGTPLEKNNPVTLDEAKRITAIFRLILPTAFIRLAGGRHLFKDKGASLFTCGANATITGDMLTTRGISINEDLQILNHLDYKVVQL